MKQWWIHALFVFCTWAACVHELHAAVVINEIAWMGTGDNANAEWIELYNADKERVDLSDWLLEAADGQPSIALAGFIQGEGYFLLERSSDETVPRVVADLVYTGSLGNGGEVLSLFDALGAVVDTVDGSEGWAIGGDNTHKHTLQRSGFSWVTAAGTPGRPNAAHDDSEYAAESVVGSDVTEKKTTSTSKEDAKEVRLPPSAEPRVVLSIGESRTVAAGTRVWFDAEVQNERGKELVLDTVTWNFGDGAVGEGQRVSHAYPYDGTYTVTAQATRSTVKPAVHDTDEITITVVPLTLRVTHADAGSIELTNSGAHGIDLSQFVLVAHDDTFRIPSGTRIRAGAHVRFAAAVTKLRPTNPKLVGLFAPDTTLVAQGGEEADSALPAATVAHEVRAVEPREGGQGTTTEEQETSEAFIPATQNTSASRGDDLQTSVEELEDTPTHEVRVAQVAAIRDTNTQNDEVETAPLWWWLLALCALIATTVAVLILVRREQEEIIEGYSISSDE